MISVFNFDFYSDGYALNPSIIAPTTITDTTLTNGIFDHWNVSNNDNIPYSPDPPTAWEMFTIMDANFNGNINAGSLDVSGLLDGFRVKRRKVGEFDWITLGYVDLTGSSTTDFTFQDNFAANLTEYEYAIVPMVGGAEGNYITNTIGSKFDGVFICDADTIYKFYSGVNYGSTQQVQKIGVFEPYGRKYPVVVSNGLINYQKGSFSGNILPNNFLEGGDNSKLTDSSRVAMLKEHEMLMGFLTNKKAKILKDWNGREILLLITGSPTTNYLANSNMGYMNVSAEFVEVGDANKGSDLYNNGLVSEAQ